MSTSMGRTVSPIRISTIKGDWDFGDVTVNREYSSGSLLTTSFDETESDTVLMSVDGCDELDERGG